MDLKRVNNTNLQVIRNAKSKQNLNSKIYYNLLYEFEKLNVNVKKLPKNTPIDMKTRELIVNIVNQVMLCDDFDMVSHIYNENIFPASLISKYVNINKEYLLDNREYFLAILAIYKLNCEPLITQIKFQDEVSKYSFSGIIIEKGVNNNIVFSNTAEFLFINRGQNLKLGSTYKGVKSYRAAIFRKLFAIISIILVFFLTLFLIYFNDTKAVAIVEVYSPLEIKINPLNIVIGFTASSEAKYYIDNLHIYGKNIDSAIIDAIKIAINEPLVNKKDFTTDTINIKITKIENLSNLSKLEIYLKQNNYKYQILYNEKTNDSN